VDRINGISEIFREPPALSVVQEEQEVTDKDRRQLVGQREDPEEDLRRAPLVKQIENEDQEHAEPAVICVEEFGCINENSGERNLDIPFVLKMFPFPYEKQAEEQREKHILIFRIIIFSEYREVEGNF
jgi:hypothetical protein